MQKLVFNGFQASVNSLIDLSKDSEHVATMRGSKIRFDAGWLKSHVFFLGLRDFIFASSYCKRNIDLFCRETNATYPNVGLGKHMKHDFCWVKMCFDLSSVNNISSHSGTSRSIVLCGEPSAVQFPSWTRSCFQRYKRRSCASLHQTSGSKWAFKKEKIRSVKWFWKVSEHDLP